MQQADVREMLRREASHFIYLFFYPLKIFFIDGTISSNSELMPADYTEFSTQHERAIKIENELAI
jgi:hypothetical protein